MFNQNPFAHPVECDWAEDAGERRVCETRPRLSAGIEGPPASDAATAAAPTGDCVYTLFLPLHTCPDAYSSPGACEG